jgi:phage terminase large subunit-like protein
MSERTKPPEWAFTSEADREAWEAGYYWDQEEAERPIRFAEKYLKPKYTKGTFNFFEWQRRFVMRLYGWRRPDGGRRFLKALLHVAKKNGKTLIVSVIGAYELFAGRSASPLVVSASTTGDNAKQVYEQIQSCTNRSEKLKAKTQCTDFKRIIKIPDRDGEFRALSADAPGSEGVNASTVIIDEAHAHRSPELYRALEYATEGREDGFTVIISTAGDDLTHWYYELVKRGRAWLAGTDLDPTFYAEIYEPLETDDVMDPATWKKANPSLDLYPGFNSERFKIKLTAAKGASLADWLSFRRYRLNLFTRSDEKAWLDIVRWDACRNPIPDSELKKHRCWLGIDGSQRIDPSSVGGVWLLPDKQFYVKSWAWVAEDGVRQRERGNLRKYTEFELEGSMTITKGDVIDKEAMKSHIIGLRTSGFQVQGVVFDPNMLWVLGVELEGMGLNVQRMPQNFKHFTDPMKEFEAHLAAGKIKHDGNTWLRYSLHSVRLETDDRGNCRPSRKKSVDHIDGAVSMLMPFAIALQASADVKATKSVYEDRGILVL